MPSEPSIATQEEIAEFFRWGTTRRTFTLTHPYTSEATLRRWVVERKREDIEDTIRKIVEGMPWRDGPLRMALRVTNTKLSAETTARIEEKAADTSVDRFSRAECYRALAMLKKRGFEICWAREWDKENKIFEARCRAAVRRAFTEAAQGPRRHDQLSERGHVARMSLSTLTRACLGDAPIPSESVSVGFGYARYYSQGLVEDACRRLGVEPSMVGR